MERYLVPVSGRRYPYLVAGKELSGEQEREFYLKYTATLKDTNSIWLSGTVEVLNESWLDFFAQTEHDHSIFLQFRHVLGEKEEVRLKRLRHDYIFTRHPDLPLGIKNQNQLWLEGQWFHYWTHVEVSLDRQ